MNSKLLIGAIVVLGAVVAGFVVFAYMRPTAGAPRSGGEGGQALQVVAAENFWGSLVSQVGGAHVHVLSVVSDPNADPHEYESNATDARAVAVADYVVENGAGYDSWMDKLLSAGGGPGRKVMKVADLLGKKEGDNPHFWYSPEYVNRVAARMENDLAAIDPADAGYYREHYAALQTALGGYQGQIAEIKRDFSGVKVGSTEDIFVYFAGATGLDLTTPPAFIQAVGDGNDPPSASVVTFQKQIKAKEIRVLVYNTQTVTPITESIKRLAQGEGIPIVGISETMEPPDALFQDWMGKEVAALQGALSGQGKMREGGSHP